ncbi:MAG: reverse transcriptase domain-containing protein [Candidatus Obscuribacterales bacterium]
MQTKTGETGEHQTRRRKRQLGIPTVMDRFIQQAVMQVLQRKWDSTFSEHSYGFRPGRSAKQAIEAAANTLRRLPVVVDIDLEKFFDRVNHDVLMNRVAANFR